MANSADPTKSNKATFDPGWNDPPTFAYTAQKTTPNRPRNFLNKRVAFPLVGNNISSDKPAVNPLSYGSGPPTVAPFELKAHNVQSTEVYEGIDSEQTLNEIKTIFLELLEQSVELGSKSYDIKRRISVMEEMWNTGKLNQKVQMQIRELSVGAGRAVSYKLDIEHFDFTLQTLQQNEPHKADEIHQALMVDHVSSVGSWMPGVKLLIRNCISRAELLSMDNE